VTGNRLRPFPSAPHRTVLATFTAHGSPVAGFQEVGSWHLAYLAPYSGPPDPLRHVAGLPGLGLLSGLRRRGAHAL